MFPLKNLAHKGLTLVEVLAWSETYEPLLEPFIAEFKCSASIHKEDAVLSV